MGAGETWARSPTCEQERRLGTGLEQTPTPPVREAEELDPACSETRMWPGPALGHGRPPGFGLGGVEATTFS